ncbi:aldehyde dehydrogenase [Streptomyces fuscichromogenes]|uniref:Aldehyde dehydrogenase n=1 Tax=Streptomyces fuscichromogenes TaxID=1324013 RepID=A0A917XG62_9ACTN|nr:aldehyde dehydrogenase [Streptomyces fuscichromogenes]GGN22679.1 aldehyde dehydrogenase [Streptomyces fuscichromogenes]
MGAAETPVLYPDLLYIDGRWQSPRGDETFVVDDANTGEPFFAVALADRPDLDHAITTARAAFDSGPWPRLTAGARAEWVERLASALGRRGPELASLWAREVGATRNLAAGLAQAGAEMLRAHARLAETFAWEEERPQSGGEGRAWVLREPVGVVGAIVPWNSPLKLALLKIAPALIAGCTVVLKASPEAPGAAYVLAECAHEVGLPAGVLNVITADRQVSELLVTDPRVDKISFTGSTAAGRRIAELLGGRIGRFTLELGGKSAAIVLDDADLDRTVRELVPAGCDLTGQVCAALTRIIVPAHRQTELVEALSAELGRVTVGSALDPSTDMGPLVTAAHRDRVEGHVHRAITDGASPAFGGGRPADPGRGHFVNPVLFRDVDNSSRIAQEEIFGPVLCVIPVASAEEAVRVANDSIYGLNSSVFSSDPDRARQIARGIRAGTVGINGYRADFGIAFGGYKQSGIGREGGEEGLRAYVETKVVLD